MRGHYQIAVEVKIVLVDILVVVVDDVVVDDVVVFKIVVVKFGLKVNGVQKQGEAAKQRQACYDCSGSEDGTKGCHETR